MWHHYCCEIWWEMKWWKRFYRATSAQVHGRAIAKPLPRGSGQNTPSVAEEYQVWRTRPCGNGGTRLQDSFRLCICHYQSVDLPFSCILGESTQIHTELVFQTIFLSHQALVAAAQDWGHLWSQRGLLHLWGFFCLVLSLYLFNLNRNQKAVLAQSLLLGHLGLAEY